MLVLGYKARTVAQNAQSAQTSSIRALETRIAVPPRPTMTITTKSSAPLFAVVGSTGVQGGSVIKAIKESSKAYRVRGITRDPSKPAGQKLAAEGCQVVAADMKNQSDLVNAFQGADIVFAVVMSEDVPQVRKMEVDWVENRD